MMGAVRAIEPAPSEIAPHEGRKLWDVTRHVAEAAASPGTRAVLVMLCAENCHGCEILAEQIERHGAALGDGVAVLKALGGDLYGDFVRDLRVGSMTIFTPGVPLALLFDVDGPRAVSLRALALGPLDRRAPAEAMAALAQGRSQWVDEAASVKLPVCNGTMCFTLDASSGFAAKLVVALAP